MLTSLVPSLTDCFQTFLEDIDVYGDRVPLDEPLCGYDGIKCKPPPGEPIQTLNTARTSFFFL